MNSSREMKFRAKFLELFVEPPFSIELELQQLTSVCRRDAGGPVAPQVLREGCGWARGIYPSEPSNYALR